MEVVIAAVVSVLIGGVIGFFTDVFKRRWAEEAERRRVIKERSDVAAQELVALMDDARGLFKDAYRHGDGPDWDELYPVLTKIDQRSLLLDTDAREQMELVTRILGAYHSVENLEGHTPSVIAFKTWDASREVLAAVLKDQPIPKPEVLARYKARVDEEHEMYEQMREDERLRKKLATE